MRLTDKQKREVITDYASGKNITDIAKKFQVSHTAISKILKNAPSFKVDEKVSKSSKELRKEIINKATNALYGKDFEKLAPDTLLKIIERLSILEPVEEKAQRDKEEKQKTTVSFEFTDTTIKASIENESNNTTEV